MCTHPKLGDEDILFTCTMIIDEEAAVEIREILLRSISKFDNKIDQAESKKLYCLNVDLLKV